MSISLRWSDFSLFSVYLKPPTTWEVFSFTRTNSTLNTGGDLRDFINYISQTKGWMPNNIWIVGIEFGAELIKGNGSFNIKNYSLN